MIRRILLAGAAGAVALGGLAFMGGSANAAPPVVITNATAATIQCDLAPTKAKIEPALKNPWLAINHNGVNDVPGTTDPEKAANTRAGRQAESVAGYNDNETVQLVKNLPDNAFNTTGPNTVSSKSKTLSCTGSITDASGTYPVVSLKIELGNFTAGTDAAPLNQDNTCVGLLGGTTPEDTAATYTAKITPKLTGAKIAPSTTNGLAIVAGGGGAIGFQISGGTTTGPLAGSNSVTTAYVAGNVLNSVGATPAKSSAPTPSKDGAKCQATLKVKSKAGNPVSASLKAPKGLKKIEVGSNIAPPNQASNICIRKGSTCP